MIRARADGNTRSAFALKGTSLQWILLGVCLCGFLLALIIAMMPRHAPLSFASENMPPAGNSSSEFAAYRDCGSVFSPTTPPSLSSTYSRGQSLPTVGSCSATRAVPAVESGVLFGSALILGGIVLFGRRRSPRRAELQPGI